MISNGIAEESSMRSVMWATNSKIQKSTRRAVIALLRIMNGMSFHSWMLLMCQ